MKGGRSVSMAPGSLPQPSFLSSWFFLFLSVLQLEPRRAQPFRPVPLSCCPAGWGPSLPFPGSPASSSIHMYQCLFLSDLLQAAWRLAAMAVTTAYAVYPYAQVLKEAGRERKRNQADHTEHDRPPHPHPHPKNKVLYTPCQRI